MIDPGGASMKRITGTCSRLAGILLLSAGGPPASAGNIYQWTDASGQVNFSDIAPRQVPAQSRQIVTGKADSSGERGLRPGELELLKKTAIRARVERKAALEARRQRDRQVAKNRKACEDVRDKFRNARKDEDLGPYAAFLRKHCW
jgi:hypothetical protein